MTIQTVRGSRLLRASARGDGSGDIGLSGGGAWTNVPPVVSIAAAAGDVIQFICGFDMLGGGSTSFFAMASVNNGGNRVSVSPGSQIESSGPNPVTVIGTFTVGSADLSGGSVQLQLAVQSNASPCYVKNDGGSQPEVQLLNFGQ